MSRGKKAKRRDELLDHPRLKQREIKEWRDKLYEEQQGFCPICGTKISKTDSVLDHCHTSGFLRGSLHRGCNALLGKIENNYRRIGITINQLSGISPSVASYMAGDYSSNPYHPSHRTEEEKRLHRNEQARLKNAAKKKPEANASKGYRNSPARRIKPRN